MTVNNQIMKISWTQNMTDQNSKQLCNNIQTVKYKKEFTQLKKQTIIKNMLQVYSP